MKLKTLVVASATLFAVSTGAQAFIVDLFDDPAGGQAVSSNSNGTVVASESGPYPSIFGGYRDLIVEKVSQSNGADDPLKTADLSVSGGLLSFSTDSLTTGLAEVQWDGMDTDGDVSTLELNLNENLVEQDGCPASGCEAIVFDVIEADAGFDFEFGIFDNNGIKSLLVGVSPGVVFPGGQFTVPFDVWLQPNLTTGTIAGFEYLILNNGVVDVTNVGAMVLGLNVLSAGNPATVNLDVSLDSITKVPEPASLALLGLGIAGLGATSGRRRRKA